LGNVGDHVAHARVGRLEAKASRKTRTTTKPIEPAQAQDRALAEEKEVVQFMWYRYMNHLNEMSPPHKHPMQD
jgi:hypothetical protein